MHSRVAVSPRTIFFVLRDCLSGGAGAGRAPRRLSAILCSNLILPNTSFPWSPSPALPLLGIAKQCFKL
jgi:hypothetical protein